MSEYETIKTCTIMPVPDEKFVDAARAAVDEYERNAPIRTLPGDLVPGGFGGPLEMAVVTRKQWRPGRRLRVAFMGGHERIRERLVPFARQWQDHANIDLDFVGESDDAEIRISFQVGDGSWSYLGTDALVIPDGQATMNYGWLTPDGPDDEYSRVVLHEFGHALSAIHEHAHPEVGIPWDREKVYEYYQLTNGWSRADVDAQVFRRYSRDETNFSAYDKDSIMHYPVPNGLTVGDYEVGWNRELSDTDKKFIAERYPRDTKEVVEVKTGEPVEASIGEHGEEDYFTFHNNRSGRSVIVSTDGPTDVVMGLYGPDDQTRLLAFDDDSGQGRNARIALFPQRGQYWIRVRHFHPQGTGRYRLKVNFGA